MTNILPENSALCQMSISSLYQLTPQSKTFELWDFLTHTEEHTNYRSVTDFEGSKILNTKLETRVIWRQNFDFRRYWQVASVWFEDKPFGIIQNAGREGLDYLEAFWTDTDVYVQAIRYIRSILPVEDVPVQTSLDFDSPKLLNFYDFGYGKYFRDYYR